MFAVANMDFAVSQLFGHVNKELRYRHNLGLLWEQDGHKAIM
jgi:hypothetical protein